MVGLPIASQDSPTNNDANSERVLILLENLGSPQPALRSGQRYLSCWHGVMGGVDERLELALAAVTHLVETLDRRDCHSAFIGDGEQRRHLEALAFDLTIEAFLSFPGWQPVEVVYDYLATAHIGL